MLKPLNKKIKTNLAFIVAIHVAITATSIAKNFCYAM